MTAKTTNKASVEQKRAPGKKHQQGTAMNWLARQLQRPVTPQITTNEEVLEIWPTQMSLPRPQTAPAIGVAVKGIPYHGMGEQPLARRRNKMPPRPPRPDLGVVRDVNAWLDESTIKPAPRLMGGLPYWREGSFTGQSPSTDVRYAIPVLQTTEDARQPSSHCQHIKSFCRRAKRIQVRMPSLLRTKSQRATVAQRRQLSQQSTLMTPFSTPNEAASAPTQRPVPRSQSLMHMVDRTTPTTVSNQGRGRFRPGGFQFLGLSQRRDISGGARFDDRESSMERRVDAVFGRGAKRGDAVWQSTAGSRIFREESMGNLSDAPSYVSGPPPPSYRSRAASVLTASSFGCVDGMSTARRQISQQRAAAQRSRGVKGTLKKLAQQAHLTKC